MKKIVSTIVSLALLAGLFALPASAAAPAATDWFALQESVNPTHTKAEFKNGRVIVNSIVNGSEPGMAKVFYTQPIDFDSFEVAFSLDNYTKCADQFISIGFINGGEDEMHLGSVSVPEFFMILRPTDLPTVIDCAQGLLVNYDTDRDMIRVGKSNFAPGVYFEGEVEASWTNVVFKVCRNDANTGYDVYINNKRVNNSNTWDFIDKIEAKTGSDKWYFYMGFKDGNYAPAQFTIKTINGEAAVDKSVSGMVQNSLLGDGEKYAAVGGLLGDKVSGGSSTGATKDNASTAPSADVIITSDQQGDGTTTDNDTSTLPTGGTDDTPDNSDPGSSPTNNGGIQAGAEGGDDGSLLWLLWVGIAVVVVAAGVCVYLFVIRKKKA